MPEGREYVKLWLSYETYFEPLADAEVGRLVRAMMKYKSDGTEPKFSGNERFTWPSIKRDMDEAERAYQEYRESRAQNGAKGGRPKKPYGFSENQKKHMVFEETIESIENQGKRNKEQGQRTKENIPPSIPPQGETGFGPALQKAFEAWIVYKQEKRQGYKPTGLKSLITQIRNNADKYGEQAVADLIERCMASNWQGIIFDILTKEQDRGTQQVQNQSAQRKSFSEIIAERTGTK